MKPKSALRSFLAIAGSSLLTISYAHAQTILADSYLTSLDISSPTTLSVTPNFPSFLNGPLTGSSDLTITGYFSSASVSAITNPLSFVNNTGNTFTGNIIVDSGALRIAGNPFATSGGGFVAGSMTSSDTITINRAGTLHMDDNVSGGYTANRFGTSGDRPAVNLAGGTFNLNGLNNASSSVQTFGALTSSSGQGTVAVFRNAGNPTLTFDSLTINSGSLLTFNGTALGTGTNDSRIIFSSAPSLTNGILAGTRFYNASPGTSELATYGSNGVTTFTAYDLSSNDINAATSTQNVQIPQATTAAALTGNVAVNSLTFSGNANWSLGGKTLTIGSGMFLRNGTNADPTITNGTLTAGDGVNDIDLNIIVAQNNTTIQAVIADNALSAVTLVKSGDGRNLNLNGGANNTYTGGTYVVGGDITTGNVASRTYLGTGKVTVDGNSFLNLQAIGTTSNASGDDFTATNGAKIQISNNNHGSVDTFNIAANSIIAGQSTSTTQGLASLTRGTTITLASGAIIAHNTGLTTTLDLATRTIQSLGTSADLYYGLGADQNNASGAITIGTGTAFKGISTDRSGRSWQQGIINIASGTTSVDFQGHATHGAAAVLTLGNGATAGQPDINFLGTGTVDINALGSLTLNDSTATYGDTGANVRFVAKAGSTLTVTAATGMGSGTGIASALVNNGGSLAIGNTTALNGAVTVEAGGRLVASQALGLTGSGTLTFNEGSILDITNATGFSDSQASAANVAAGTIVRVTNSAQPGTTSVTLDSFLGSKSPIYQLNGDIDVPEPSAPGTTTMTLNKNGSGVGGIVTNGLASAFFRNNVNGQVTIGANGGVMAATSNTELQVQETIVGTGVTLTIGTTAIIDGAPKLGSVALGSAASSNTYTGQTIINAGSLRTGYNDVLGATTNQITINTGGTLNVNGTSQTVGNLTGTGGAITLGNGTLIIGQGDNGGGNYQGSIQGSGGKVTKTGTGTITLSGTNTYTGATAINVGTLLVNGNQSTASGNVTVAANATLGGTGTLGGNTAIADNGKLEFNLSTAAGSHNGLEIATGKALTFSGASTLTITSSGGASTGLYTLVSGGNNIVGLVPATVVLPPTWTADPPVIVGNELRLNITSTGSGGPGPVDHFVISAISSPQTVGTPITGITITAEDSSNATATSFTGTVTFGGTGGFSGTSASFTAGVLNSVSVTPTVAGSNLTFTVDDGASHTGTTTITTIQTQYQAWSGGAPFDADANGDGVDNGMAFLLGAASPTSAVPPLTVSQTSGDLVLNFSMRNLAARGTATLNVEHSSDLGISDPWASALVPDSTQVVSGVSFNVAGGSPTNTVIATIPAANAAAGKLFGRLKANQ